MVASFSYRFCGFYFEIFSQKNKKWKMLFYGKTDFFGFL
jgi:hypothetical protein